MYDNVDYSKFDWWVIHKSHVVTQVAMEMECVEITRGHTQRKVDISHMWLERVEYAHHILLVQLRTALLVQKVAMPMLVYANLHLTWSQSNHSTHKVWI